MNDTEYAAFASEVLGRPVAANDQFSYDDLRLIRAAETEREIAEREERAAAEKAEAERQKKLEADPLFERRARAAQLREEREAHEQPSRHAGRPRPRSRPICTARVTPARRPHSTPSITTPKGTTDDHRNENEVRTS